MSQKHELNELYELIDDPLKTIFKLSSENSLMEEISSIENIPNFFKYIISETNDEDNKIIVIENFIKIIKKNRYICEYFSSFENKSIYLYLFELYISKNSSDNFKHKILSLINELVLFLETNKSIYEFIFQKISKIYNINDNSEEKSPENLCNYLTLLDTLLSFNEKITKPENYFCLSGNSKFSLDLTNKTLGLGYCISFILNFKMPDTDKNDGLSNLINIKFSNEISLILQLKFPGYLLIIESDNEPKMIKAIPKNEYIVLLINIIVEDNNFQIYTFLNGENKLSPVKCKNNNINMKKDTIQSLDFFENFYGEVTSITMLIQKEKSKPIINSPEFLPVFTNFEKGFHKKKELKKFIEIISAKDAIENTEEKPNNKIIDNCVFCFTCFNYFNNLWKNEKNKNLLLDDYFGNFQLKIIEKNDSIRNHRYQYYQKKIYLVCDITNFLPIAELFIIHPGLLTERNFELYLTIIANIINYRKRNVEAAKNSKFFDIIFIFFEKYQYKIFTEKILNAFINIGKIMFRNNLDLTETYFKHILFNEKILSKYDKTLQLKFWTQMALFCESDSQQLENIIKMNRICLILRFYDNKRYKLMCCKEHHDCFKNQFCNEIEIMDPPMKTKLADIWKIINLIINSQKPDWVLSLFKLLLLDLSPCLTNFITIAVTKALIRKNKGKKKNEIIDMRLTSLNSIIVVKKENCWLEEFINLLLLNKYKSIIINIFNHSLPDVRFNLLKLIYQIYITLLELDLKDESQAFFNFMKNYILPQKMFYEKENGKNILILNDFSMKKYIEDIILLIFFWGIEKEMVEIDDKVDFEEKEEDINSVIKNCQIFEVILELIKQINYDLETISIFLIRFQLLSKNIINCDIILYNYKILLMLLDIIFVCYKINIKEYTNNSEMCLSLGIELVSDIYINALKYNGEVKNNEKNPFYEIELIFLWGSKIINNMEENQKKINDMKNIIFSFMEQIFTKILQKFKIVKKSEIEEDLSNIKKKDYYEQNYIILLYKLFEFSFEYVLDKINLEVSSEKDITFFNITFLTSMRVFEKRDKKNLEIYWKDYPYFKEIYDKVSYMWNKKYIYQKFDIEALNKMNKVVKYESILENYILNNNNRNIFLKDIKYLLNNFTKINNYNNYFEISTKDNFIEISKFDNILNLSFMKMIQIMFISILTIIISKQNEEQLLFWLKEFKHYIKFIIISSCNITIKEKENKECFIDYINIQEQILYILYSSLHFLYQLRMIATICKEKIDKICCNIFLLCLIILKYNFNFRKKNKISDDKKFNTSYKYNINDLSGTALFILFHDYVDKNVINLDKIAEIADENNYKENMRKFLDNKDFQNNFFLNEELKNILYEKYFPFKEYKTIIELRVNTIKRINKQNSQNSDQNKKILNSPTKDIIELLPSYEQELMSYSNNSLEQRLIRKNFYRTIKKNLFSWDGYWSDKKLFFEKYINDNNNDINNDNLADMNKVSKIKYKIMNHYTKSYMKILLVPIFDMSYYLPDFSKFDNKNLFNNKINCIVNIDIDKSAKLKEDAIKRRETQIIAKENYLKTIYIKSNPILAKKLSKISDSLDLAKEDEFSILKDENKSINQSKNYYLCCLVKPSHHIKGVCFIGEHNIHFHVFLNQKSGNAMSGVNIAFTDKDEDYDINRKTCYGSFFMFHQKDKNLYKISIKYENINFILLKRYFYKNSAIEIFTKTNKSYFFNFKYEKDRDIFLQKMNKVNKIKNIVNDLKENKDNNVIGYAFGDFTFCHKKKKDREKEKEKNVVELSKIIKDWIKWRINTFSFLMHLNFFANRSYNDLSQYPIFPWILSKYSHPIKIEKNYLVSSLYYAYHSNNIRNESNMSENMDNISLDNNSNSAELEERSKKKKKDEMIYNYRDMKLPMGMMELTETGILRKEDFIERYNDMKNNSEETFLGKPFYYGSNYSNPFFVCNYLMRLFPFTSISIEMQGRLDDAERLFFSVEKSFENSSSLQGDVRELIPEFFCLPEIFLNINDIYLGILEGGKKLYNVDTPCGNNAYAFVEIMNRILNGDTMSKYINDWIDLIFGYKARGKEAENAKNIFSEKSYQENINLEKIEDKVTYFTYAEYGLIPNQIMIKECSKRRRKKELKKVKEITEINPIESSKIKIGKIKHDSSADKKIKNLLDKNKYNIYVKNELIHLDIFEGDKLMMLYESNNNYIITENKINSSTEDIVNIYKIPKLKNKIKNNLIISNKLYKFFNEGKNLIIGGYYDGKIELIYLEEKGEKKRDKIYPFSEEEPILSLKLSTDENYIFLGNTIGNIAIYKINHQQEKLELYQKIFDHKKNISDIDINLDLNMFSTSSINGNINLYTWPLCKLVRSIKMDISDEYKEKCKNIFLSESSLACIIIIMEKENFDEFYSYSINGQFLISAKEQKNMSNIIKFKNLNSYEYLAYCIDGEIKIRNLPSLSLYLKFDIQNNNEIKFLCINEDLNAIYGINEDGSQMQLIKN